MTTANTDNVVLTEDQVAAARRFAETIIADAYKHAKENTPERLAKLTQEDKDVFEAKWHKDAVTLTTRILGKGKALYDDARIGRFHPSNRESRALFAALTGMTLPSRAGDTMATLRFYVGEAAWDGFAAARENTRLAEQLDREAAIAARHQNLMNDVMTRIVGNIAITGDEFADLVKHLKPHVGEVHPRTIGTIRNRVASIQEGTARVRGGSLPAGVHQIYTKCVSYLKANPPGDTLENTETPTA